ncbi:MAG TPA: twin-arginine translocation signal domain-containing protein [Gemmataceae bacterium]|nr:twin-arginine translocation signal domain-containing protein [Gemmataceae bacterium]
MDRRLFLKEAGMAGALALLGGGGLFARRAWARGKLEEQLVGDALDTLRAQADEEERDFPARAAEGIRRPFAGMCLNVATFCDEISAPRFQEKLQRLPPEEREDQLLSAFCRCLEPDRVLAFLRQKARDVGKELDRRWDVSCREVARRWGERLQGRGPDFDAEDFGRQVTELVRDSLQRSARRAAKAGRPAVLGDTQEDVGASALLLVPLAKTDRLELVKQLPLFVVRVCRRLFAEVAGWYEGRRGNLHKQISGQLADLGDRVAREFEREVSRRLVDLHGWQEQAVRVAARRQAEARVGYL